MYSYYAAVKEFHIAFNQLAPDKPTKLTPQQLLGRMRLITEELAELLTALDKKDIVETADALGDLIYVTVGTYVAHGYNPEELNDWLLHVTRKEVPIIRDAAKAITDKTPLCLEYIWKMYHLLSAYNLMDDTEVIGAMVITELMLAAVLDLPIEKIFQQIHASNMTKVGGRQEGGKFIKPATYKPVDLSWVKDYCKEVA